MRSQFEAGLSRRLAHVVAAVCDDLGLQEEVLRIDRLDLPLGAFAIEELEREAPLALERALREALLQALAAARHNLAPGQRLLAPAEARLDRLATVLRHGLLPHRVASEAFAPADDLLALLRADPTSLLALLLAALAPADAALILAYLADLLLLHQQRPMLPVDADRLRRSLWLVTLTLLLCGLAAEHRLPYSLLLRQLDEALRTYSRLKPWGAPCRPCSPNCSACAAPSPPPWPAPTATPNRCSPCCVLPPATPSCIAPSSPASAPPSSPPWCGLSNPGRRLWCWPPRPMWPWCTASSPAAPAADPFERLSFLRQLAQSQQLVYSYLLRTFATALRRPPRSLALQTSLPALLESLLAAELADGAQADGAPAPDQGLAATSSTKAGVAEPAAASSPSASTSSRSSRYPSIDLSG